MKLKLTSVVFFMTMILFSFEAKGIQFAWNPSSSIYATGYKIYYGAASGLYTNSINVGNVTNASIANTNFINNTTYYFAATAYDTNGLESTYSNEVIWTNTVIPQNITYVGVRIDYGINLTSLSSQQVMVMSVTNQPNYFYNESLIITNHPFVGTRPVNTNNYVYLGTSIQYGSNLTTLNSAVFPLISFTNPPAYYYRSALVLTNNAF
jgi:hypothetical protein